MTFRARLQPWSLAAGLLLACLLVYSPVFHAGFLWDDDLLITGNALVKSAAGLPGIWSGKLNPDYFPLTSTLFWLEYRFWGPSALGYHLVNVALHGLCAILLWRVLTRVGTPWPWVAALLFAVHPVAVGTVAWISEGKNTLALFWALVAFLSWLRFVDSPARSRGLYAWALFSFLLAVLSKTSVVMLPFVILLTVWWREQRLTFARIWQALPFFAISLLLGSVTLWFQQSRAIRGAEIPLGGGLSRLGGAARALCFYAGKLLWPAGLDIIYPAWPPQAHFFLLGAGSGLLLLAVFAMGWRYRRAPEGRACLFGIGSFAILLLPVLGLVKMYFLVFAPVADHLQYPAMPAFLSLAVAAADAGAKRLSLAAARLLPWAFAGIALLLGLLSFEQSGVYRDPASLWAFAAQRNPASFQAQAGLAQALVRQGRLGEALPHAQLAVQENPTFLTSQLNLAILLGQMGRDQESIATFRAALRIEPNVAAAHFGLGNVLLKQGALAAAIVEFQASLRLDSTSAATHHNLALAFAGAGQPEAARAEYRAAAHLPPESAAYHLECGVFLYQQGHFAEAAAEFGDAVRLLPQDFQAHNNLGAALMAAGRMGEARVEFQQALKLNPGSSQARINLERTLR